MSRPMLHTDATGPRRPVADVAFLHDAEPPREWAERLAVISAPSDALSFLMLVWEPGDPWYPVQRWMLYDVRHPKLLDLRPGTEDADTLEELRGPHPRSAGHMCTAVPISAWAVRPDADYLPCLCRRKTEAWRGGPCLSITLTQWKLYQRTGYIGRPYWVIQGVNGGHKVHWNRYERFLLEQAGVSTDTPNKGALPYAPFDERVAAAIIRDRRIRQMDMTVAEYKRTMGPTAYQQYKNKLERDMRAQIVAHMREQLREVNDLAVKALGRGELDDSPRTDIDYEKLDELSDETFIETGNVLHHSKV